jgi:hypothetical protein
MKTTLELPDALLSEAKELAAKQGVPFRQVVADSLRDHLQRSAAPRTPFRLGKPVTFRSKELIDTSDWSIVKAMLNEERDRR